MPSARKAVWRLGYKKRWKAAPPRHTSRTMKTTFLCLSLLLPLLLLLPGGGAAGAEVEKASGPHYCTCYTEFNGGGFFHTFYEYCPNLSSFGIDNSISSVTLTGFWIFYDNYDYNSYSAGQVHWVHGIEYSYNFPYSFSDEASSLRYGGTPGCLNCDSWTVYVGTYFTGAEYYGVQDSPSFGSVTNTVSSILLTGTTSWTFYTGPNYSGFSLCLRPDSAHDTGPNGQVLDLGIVEKVTDVGFPDNGVGSVKRGCWSKNVVHTPKTHVKGNTNSGSGFSTP